MMCLCGHSLDEHDDDGECHAFLCDCDGFEEAHEAGECDENLGE